MYRCRVCCIIDVQTISFQVAKAEDEMGKLIGFKAVHHIGWAGVVADDAEGGIRWLLERTPTTTNSDH
jgi:hypothetical protein